jgi:hypothetical protein
MALRLRNVLGMTGAKFGCNMAAPACTPLRQQRRWVGRRRTATYLTEDIQNISGLIRRTPRTLSSPRPMTALRSRFGLGALGVYEAPCSFTIDKAALFVGSNAMMDVLG